MNPKLKAENYNLLGGINSKISLYQNSPLEFLNIKNFDFQTPNALTSRWGSTQYVTQNFTGPIASLYEFTKLNGASSVIVGVSGGLWYGATTGIGVGISTIAGGVTIVIQGSTTWGAITSRRFQGIDAIYYVQGTGLGTGLQRQGVPVEYQDDPSEVIGLAGTCYEYINPLLQTDNKLSAVTFENFMFAADGSKFFKFDGATTYPVGLPFPRIYDTDPTGGSLNIPLVTLGASYFTAGYYHFYASYVNNRGFESQIWPVLTVTATGITNAVSFSGNSFNFVQSRMQIMTPLAYGISSINIYSYFSANPLSVYEYAFGLTAAPASLIVSGLWEADYVFHRNVPASGSTLTTVDVGATLGDFGDGYKKLAGNVGSAPNLTANTYVPLGATFVHGITTNPTAITEIDIVNNYAPSILEVYKERLFATGFSLTPSLDWFSNIAEPEGFVANANFEVRTNDGDYITAQKAYATRLYTLKKTSFHILNGDGPANFFLQEGSLQYGCLNKNCAIVFDDILIFLDQKGVMIYNGSKLECLSGKVQPFFDQMNYSVALNTAVMVHDKLRNQILVAIPTGESTNNNLTMVYDYLAQAWTTYTGFIPTIFARIQGRNNLKTAFYGTPTGTINWFGPSFITDNGVGFTGYFKTRFLHDMGESVEKQWRRLYMNADPVGSTYMFNVNFYQDYGPSIVYSVSMPLGEFQNRIDFGIPAKSLAFELHNFIQSYPLRIYGFTIESRLQRRV